MNNETFLLFTYGTLMNGERNEHLLKEARFVGKAVTKPVYKLFRIDGNFVFPAIIDEGNTAVSGEVYEVPIAALPGMDRMEGHPHFYRRQPVELEGEMKDVIAYFFVKKQDLIDDYPEIESGNWLNR